MIEILTVGDELTSGSTADANACFIARSLYAVGLSVARITTVGDGIEHIVGALNARLATTRFMIVTGGLGPTDDDRTAEAAARAFGRPLLLDRAAMHAMEQRYRECNRTMSDSARKQAMLPEGSRVLPNPVGTACGFLIDAQGCACMFLPGVPEEVRAITAEFLVDYIKAAAGVRDTIINKTLKVFGLWESVIQERLKAVLPKSSTVALAFYPQYPEIRIRITGRGSEKGAVRREVERFSTILYDTLGDHIYADSDEPLEAVVGRMLVKKRATVAVAESCTGGLITHRLTSVAGSSRYIERALVVYSNAAKVQLLGVPHDMIERYGAVSEHVARVMAEQVRMRSAATYGLAVTGIAGPSGGTPEKPVGTVYTALATPGMVHVHYHQHQGDREHVTLMSAHCAMNLLRKELQSSGSEAS